MKGKRNSNEKVFRQANWNGTVPDQIGTLAQVGTSPNLGWPNKELRGSPPG